MESNRIDNHNHADHGRGDPLAKNLVFAIALLSATLLLELAGALFTGSLALLADAGHVLMDLFTLAISYGASRLAKLPATSTKTYGWHRVEILAALLNGLLLMALSLGLFREAAERIIRQPKEVLAIPMLVVALIGLAANLVIAFRLRGHHSHDLNLRSAYLHVLGDAGASLGVVVGAIIIQLTDRHVVDALISIVIGMVLVVGAIRLVLHAGHILLEGVPRGMSLDAVAGAIRGLDGVKDVHDVHIWTLCSHIVNLSCHVNIDRRSPEDHDCIVRAVSRMLWEKFSIMHSTIQVDYTSCGSRIVSQDMEHPES